MRASHLLTLVVGALLSLSCARGPRLEVPPTSPFAHSSMSHYDAALRHYVVARDTGALELIEQGAPKDRLVRLLNRGLYLHRLGRWEESTAALQKAEALAEERYTKSISQNVAAFFISDNVLDYTPPAHERAMIHYYGMINYLALGNLEDALVEARRANMYLARYNRDHESRRSYSNDAFVQYVAGLLHLSAGDENDALVSLRQADSAFRSYEVRYGIYPPRMFGRDLARVALRMGVLEVAERAIDEFGLAQESLGAERYADQGPTGELLVIVENGFIAHRTEQKIYIPILKPELDSISSDDHRTLLVATSAVMSRTVPEMKQASQEGRDYAREYEDGLLIGVPVADADLISFAWPSYDLDSHGISDVSVAVDGNEGVAAPVVNDFSAIAARDFEEEKPKILGRMIARGILKYLAVQQAENIGEEAGGEVLGFLAKVGATAAATLTERADVRSWSLLPSDIRVARFTLPPGEHAVSLSLRDADGSRRVLDLRPVEIHAGRLTVKTSFVTGDYSGDQERFRAAKAKVDYAMPDLNTDVSEQSQR